MKILRKLFFIIFILMMLVLVIIGAGALNPDISKKISSILYPGLTTTSTQGADSAYENGSDDSSNKVDELNASEDGNINKLPDEDQSGDDKNSDGEIDKKLDSSETAGIIIPKESEYVAPSESDIEVPSDVAGKTGLEETQDFNRQVADSEAKSIEDELSYGETGDGLDFDGLFYPYYQMLDDEGKHLYRQVYANADALNYKFKPIEVCTPKKLKNVFEAVIGDHPELFWLETGYSSVAKRNGQVVEMDLSFNQTSHNITQAKANFDQNAEEILSVARDLPSDFDKEKYVHDALADKITYNLSAPMNQSAYSALVKGSTVCAGYARAMQYLMTQLNVPCYYCTGYAGENHAWNIIKLDNDFYNVDVTWDDSSAGNYDYFNKTDADFSKNHMRKNMSVYLPACNGTDYQVKTDEDAGLRSVEEAGLTENDVIYNMADYYNNCYAQIVNNGMGSYSFQNIIAGEDMFNTWRREHSDKTYQSAYLDSAMEAIGARNCQIGLSVEKLKGDKYLINHATRIN